MAIYREKDIFERRNAANEAKKALLERYKARPAADDPQVVARQAERKAILEARSQREAEKQRLRQEKLAREAAERAAREAAAEAARREAEAKAAEEARLRDAEENERIARLLADEAERKAKRDARYAARKARVAIGEQAEQTLLKERGVKDRVSSQSAIQAAGTDREGKPASIAEVGAAVKADVVIYATVDEFSLTRDGQTYSPGAVLRVKVVDATGNARLWPENPAGHVVSVRLSPKTSDLPTSTAARFQAEDELARQAGQEIAWLFMDHEAPRGIKGPE